MQRERRREPRPRLKQSRRPRALKTLAFNFVLFEDPAVGAVVQRAIVAVMIFVVVILALSAIGFA